MWYRHYDERYRLFKPVITLAWVAMMLVSCAGDKGTQPDNDLNKDKDDFSTPPDVKKTDVIWYKDGHAPDYGYETIDRDQPVPEALYFMPKDAYEGARCLKWEKKTPDDYPSGWEDFCWDPPEHWCRFMTGGSFYACSADGKLCCYLGPYCIPCGWTSYDKEQSKPDTDPEKCQELRDIMYDRKWMVCQEWE